MSLYTTAERYEPCVRQSQPAHGNMEGWPYYIETLYEGGSGKLNEDRLLVRKNLFAVFDGASSLTSNSWQGKTGAWWASQCASRAIAATEASLYRSFNQANQAIAEKMTVAGINQKQRLNLWSCTGAAIRLYDTNLEYAQIGDALIICIRHDGSYFLPVPYYNHDRETLAAWKILAMNGCSNIRSALVDQIANTRLQMNRTFGVLNGELEMVNFLNCGTISLAEVQSILLFTDGLHWPSENPSQKEDFSDMVSSYQDSGLYRLHQNIRAIEKSDPQCVRYPRFKQHDDIAAVAITLCT